MKEKLEAKIVIKENGQVICHDPVTNRDVPTGLTAKSQGDRDRAVHQLKSQLERAGNRVTVKEMSR